MSDIESPPVSPPPVEDANDLPNDPGSPASATSAASAVSAASTPADKDDTALNGAGAESDGPDNAMDDSDDESLLSEVDEAQFEDFDAANIAIDERPALDADEDNLKLIGRHKRKRGGDGDEGGRKKKRKEAKREKKSRKKRSDDDNLSGADGVEGRRSRKKREEGERARRTKAAAPEEDESLLDPEERRRRALDRAMDDALRNPNRRRSKKEGIDLQEAADAEIDDVQKRMCLAAQADSDARKAGNPAFHKLKMLPEVVSLLNRNTIVSSLVDPDTNLIEAVRFFLEPLEDGSLPAYDIQRDLFSCLAKLPITKDVLRASGVGKVIVFYTKSKRVQPEIKRQAERLLAEWSRPILQKTDDYSKKVFQTAEYDPTKIPVRAKPKFQIRTPTTEDNGPGKKSNRAQRELNTTSYSIVPIVTNVKEGGYARPIGASGEDRFRKMKARQMAAMGKGRKR